MSISRTVSAALASVILVTASGVAFAADAPKAPVSKEDHKAAEKACKAEHKGDKEAYKECLKEKLGK